jgi:5,10-methylene-tetrahydrofolate dehydrogenase/methenyl tetrahydrofolate cyclohydrolase
MSGSPGGCVKLLQRSGVEVAGKEVVVLGKSNIVGMPVRANSNIEAGSRPRIE